MNVYARFFSHEALLHSAEELFDFLEGLPDVRLTDAQKADIEAYLDSSVPYPKRYKLRPRVYFILIKTTAESMEEFKANHNAQQDGEQASKKDSKATQLAEEREGWYRGSISFKRVIEIPGTGKFQYRDTPFEALVYAKSGQDCYARIIAHLRGRKDIDMRSQFPSSKGINFSFKYEGTQLPAAEPEEEAPAEPADGSVAQ